jgi:hypothetical protein
MKCSSEDAAGREHTAHPHQADDATHAGDRRMLEPMAKGNVVISQ